jgi:RecJ-like exonuclease
MTYRWQTEQCEWCDEGWQCSDAFGDRRCDICEGRGEVTASCHDCAEIAPLDDEQLCEVCNDGADLTIEAYEAKYGGRVNDALAPGRSAA